MPQTGGCKPVIGLSPGYGACPPHPRHSPSPPCPRCPHSRRLLCFAADCNKGVWMTPGQCPEMSSADLLRFPHCLTASHLHWPGLTVSPSIHFQYHILPHPAPSCILSEATQSLSQTDRLLTKALSYCRPSNLFLRIILHFLLNMTCLSHVVTYRHAQHELLCSVCSIL